MLRIIILSHTTAKRDKTEKKDIYEKSGVEEYWIVSPQVSVEIYYLENGRYVLQQHYMFQADKTEEDYNAEQEIVSVVWLNVSTINLGTP